MKMKIYHIWGNRQKYRNDNGLTHGDSKPSIIIDGNDDIFQETV